MQRIITPDYLSEHAMLTSEMIVAWKIERGVYNFKSLPKKAIIGIEENIFSQHIHFYSKRLRGIKGINYIRDGVVFCAGFGSGAPAIITLLEELRVLGVEEFIFVGLAGILTDDIKTGDIFYVNKAVSGSGATSYYYPDNPIEAYDPDYTLEWGKKLKMEGVTCFSTDSPFRETPSLIVNIRARGCKLIEMECAAIFAFTQYYRLKAVCLLVAADTLSDHWTPPSNEVNLASLQKRLVTRILKSI
jgi:uridine phosphorylase